MASNEELRVVMAGCGVLLLIAACFTPFGAFTPRDRWLVSFPVFVMVLIGVMLIVLS